MDLGERLALIRENVRKACVEAGTDYSSVRIVPAVKTVSPEKIAMLSQLGITEIGENRVQEMLDKFDKLPGFSWHFIGALQTNKVKYIIDKTCLIHSLDRLTLADEIERQAEKRGITVNALIEVNIGGEKSKSGVSEKGLSSLYAELKKRKRIELCGFMTVMPPSAPEKLYAKMRDVFTDYKKSDPQMSVLSSGMSDDYETAVRYGANLIRPGTALFGKRI